MPSITSFAGAVVPSVGLGHDPWSNYANAKLDDGQYASVLLSKGRDSEDLGFSGFDFSAIPANATIDSITVSYEAHASLSGQVITCRIRVSQPGQNTATEPETNTWPTSDATYSTSGPPGIWGALRPWNPATDLGPDFAVSFACENLSDAKKVTAYLDYLKVTVSYHT